MNQISTNRVLYRSGLALAIFATLVGEVVTLITGDRTANQGWANVFLTFMVLWILSFQTEHGERLKRLERDEKSTRQQTTALIGRAADLMDSARRLDPIYATREIARKEREKWARENGMSA